jgi:hypothetical protein
MKRCPTCKEAKPPDEFYKSKSTVCCRTCHKKYCQKYYRERSLNRNKWDMRSKKYGVSIEVLAEMDKKQEGRCAICQREYKTPHLDHCHVTGKVRGLLCSACNKGLGFFGDELDHLQAAVNYLKEF